MHMIEYRDMKMTPSHWNINPENLLRIPGEVWVYWKNTDGIYLGCNDFMSEKLRFSTRQDIIGRTDFDLNIPKKEAEFYRFIDKQIIETGIAKECKDTATLTDSKLEFLVLKTPLFEPDNKIVGLVGFSYCLYDNEEQTPTNTHLSALTINGVGLSPREMQIIQLLVRGKMAKQIAPTLGLSTRTIEHYIVNIRKKFNSPNKSDLIDKIIDKILLKKS